MNSNKLDSTDTGVQAHKKDIPPEPVTELSEDSRGYTIDVSVVNQTTMGSKINATDEFVHYRIQEDLPELLLEADNIFSILQKEFESSPVNRHSGQSFEIVVSQISSEEDVPIRYQRHSDTQTFVVLQEDNPDLLEVISEFLDTANKEFN